MLRPFLFLFFSLSFSFSLSLSLSLSLWRTTVGLIFNFQPARHVSLSFLTSTCRDLFFVFQQCYVISGVNACRTLFDCCFLFTSLIFRFPPNRMYLVFCYSATVPFESTFLTMQCVLKFAFRECGLVLSNFRGILISFQILWFSSFGCFCISLVRLKLYLTFLFDHAIVIRPIFNCLRIYLPSVLVNIAHNFLQCFSDAYLIFSFFSPSLMLERNARAATLLAR